MQIGQLQRYKIAKKECIIKETCSKLAPWLGGYEEAVYGRAAAKLWQHWPGGSPGVHGSRGPNQSRTLAYFDGLCT